MFPEGRLFEFALVGILALIVVGPKDLPILMRRVGRFVAHMRAMAAEFRASFDEMARQSELDELRKEVEALRTGQSLQHAVGLGPDSGVHEVLDDIHAGLSTSVTAAPPIMTSLSTNVPETSGEAETHSAPAPEPGALSTSSLSRVEPAGEPHPATPPEPPLQAAS